MPFELSLKNFLYLQVVLFVLGFIFLLWRPQRRAGLRLKLGGAIPTGGANSPAVKDDAARPGASRSLQVFFNYNGHTFEAYEVLGVPAGASLATVEKIFFEQKKLADPESRSFLEAAYQALNSSLRSAKN